MSMGLVCSGRRRRGWARAIIIVLRGRRRVGLRGRGIGVMSREIGGGDEMASWEGEGERGRRGGSCVVEGCLSGLAEFARLLGVSSRGSMGN